MTPSEAAKLLGHCALFDNRTVGAIDSRAWSVALRDIPLDQDALDAVARFYSTPPAKPGERLWIQPHDVKTHRKEIRAERLANFVFESTSDDDDPFYLARYRQRLDAVASGRVPAPADAPALEGGPHPRVADRLAGIGREVPEDDDPKDAVRRAGPLGVECPVCNAPIGRRCRTGRSGHERRTHHPVRAENAKRAAAGLPPVDLAAREADELAERKRRQEVSRLYLVEKRRAGEAAETGEAS